MDQKFLVCETCGNIVAMVNDAGVPVMCCGQKMKEIVPGTTDAAVDQIRSAPLIDSENDVFRSFCFVS